MNVFRFKKKCLHLHLGCCWVVWGFGGCFFFGGEGGGVKLDMIIDH